MSFKLKDYILLQDSMSNKRTNAADFKTVTTNRKTTTNSRPKIPKAVLEQRELRKKYKYTYRSLSNGNIENNSTIYLTTRVAHPYQVEKQFKDVVAKAKTMPEIFGDDFECDIQINVVRRSGGEYMGYGFVDVTNPKLYYALLGYNVDGSDRAEYVNDPDWIRPKHIPKVIKEKEEITTKNLLTVNWCESEDEDKPLSHPKIRKELSPLLTLGEYEYDEQQKLHLETDATHGTFTLSPAYITPGVGETYDDCSLYVSEVPAIDYDFLYALFARYARTNSNRESEFKFYPRINIKKCTKEFENNIKTGIFAIVEYAHPVDAAFVLTMNQRVRASYNGKDVYMPVRYAFKSSVKKNTS